MEKVRFRGVADKFSCWSLQPGGDASAAQRTPECSHWPRLRQRFD